MSADELLHDGLAQENGWTGSTAKEMIGKDEHAMRVAFQGISRSPEARRVFQHQFAELNKERIKAPSLAHDTLAELLHRRIIKTVICLNWDTLLETAYLSNRLKTSEK